MEGACNVNKDPLRHIVNRVLADAASKIPTPVLEDLRKAFAKAEDKFKFTIYGGDPIKLIDYFGSDDFADLINIASSLNIEWVLKEILEAIAEEYRITCPEVARKAIETLKELEERKGSTRKEAMSPEAVYRKLRILGYNPELLPDKSIKFDLPSLSVTVTVKDDVIHYSICRKGKVYTVEGLLTKVNKISEI